MDRAPRAASAAFFLVLALGFSAVWAAPREIPGHPAAAVAWPASTLLVSEVQTGGAAASDEFVELSNVGDAPADLAGLEVVYVTATGGTVTRKAAWTQSVILEPGRHLLLANTLGVHALLADALYSGGLAATGGSIVLRPVGGNPIDALGWGDASSAFVEGFAAPAPPAGSSIERRPGGLEGNTQDTNDNLADWFIQPQPSPQTLSAPPVPVPVESPAPGSSSPPPPSAWPSPSVEPLPSWPPSGAPSTAPSPSPTPSPAGSPTPDASLPPGPSVPPAPSPSTEPSPSGGPSPSASPAPSTAADPEPSPTGTPVPSGSPSPGADEMPILEARSLPDGARVTIAGLLTVPLGLLEDGRSAFVQDAGGGIAVYLDQAPASRWVAGTLVRLTGTLDERYAARTLRVSLADLEALGAADLPEPIVAVTGAVGEALEARRVRVRGLTIGSPTTYADGLGLLVDDGTGPVRVIVSADALDGLAAPSGTLVTVTGPVGQRDTTGTGSAGYRIHATQPGELAVMTQPDPSVTPGPSATPAATGLPSPSPSLLPSPSVAPSPAPADQPISIAEARLRPVGSRVTVAGLVTSEAGRLGIPSLIAIEDASGGVVVRLADGMAPPARGSWVQAQGTLADPYGQLEIRLGSGGFSSAGQGALPAPLAIRGEDLGESSEGRLVVLEGTVVVTPSRSTSNDISLDVTDAAGTRIRIMADASSRLVPDSLRAGQAYRLVGIAGQRSSRKGILDGYRIWLRDSFDIMAIPPIGSGSAPGGTVPVLPLAAAVGLEDRSVVVEGRVTAPATLLDGSGRRIVIEDGSGAIEVLIPLGSSAPDLGSWVRIRGTVGRAYGAPRLRASEVHPVPVRGELTPAGLHGQPGDSLEWRLAIATGTIEAVTRLGARWRAELKVDGTRILLDGLPGSAIPSTAVVPGQRLTVSGIVRRPYPGATERRFSLVPRSAADLRTPAGAFRGPGTAGTDRAPASAVGGSRGEAGGDPPAWSIEPREMDLATIQEHPGAWVRVGGLVVAANGTNLVLDDGTALAPVRLEGEAAAYAGLLLAGDPVSALGVVVPDPLEGWGIAITSTEGLVRVGALGQPVAIAAGGIAPGVGTDGSSDHADGVPARRSRVAVAEITGRATGLPAAPAWILALGLLAAAMRMLHRRWLRWRIGRRVSRRLAELAQAAGEAA